MLSCLTPAAGETSGDTHYLSTTDSILSNVSDLYQTDDGLLTETYPVNPNQKIAYLADGTQQNGTLKASFLQPHSGMMSGRVALHKTIGNERYKKVLEKRILPGMKQYQDNSRLPTCYQSYPTKYGQHGRYYDDNIQVVLGYCDYYQLTHKPASLEKTVASYQYIYSRWSDEIGGGIFWCEQQKEAKHTCSSAPSTVLGVGLYRLTEDTRYLEKTKETYVWTRKHLRGPTGHLYWDNIDLKGKVSKEKYAYNSEQMIQAGVLLYEETGDGQYLYDAQQTTAGTDAFLRIKADKKDPTVKVHEDMAWFSVILFRGLKALHRTDKNPAYVNAMVENTLHVWESYRDKNGLSGRDWSGRNKEQYKWPLDNACLVEFFAEI